VIVASGQTYERVCIEKWFQVSSFNPDWALGINLLQDPCTTREQFACQMMIVTALLNLLLDCCWVFDRKVMSHVQKLGRGCPTSILLPTTAWRV
jgi:hypothetical protein